MTMDPRYTDDLHPANDVEFHLMLRALAGKTAEHLRDGHGVESAADSRENARLHLLAHGLPEDYRAQGFGRLFERRRRA